MSTGAYAAAYEQSISDPTTFWGAAAGAGDVASQELLATLLVAGPALHGGAVPADLCEAAHWARRALAQGSWLAPHQLFVLSGARQAQPAAARCLAP